MTKHNIPFFNYPALFTNDEEELVRIFRDIGRRGAFILQQDLVDFETKLAKYVGAKYAVGVNNATDGLHFALVAGGIKPGDEVIVCSHTMQATAAAVHAAGGIPVPVEVGPDRCIDPAAIEPAITSRTRAVMPTDLNGRACDMDAIQEICRRRELLLFEDAAQALGAKFRGKSAGTFGVASAISFYPAKTLGCLGDGGAVITNNPEVHRVVLQLRSFGMDDSGECQRWALNSRLDNLQAAFLNHRLSTYDGVVSRRRAIAARYHARLYALERVGLPPSPSADERWFDIYQNYEIEADRRDELQAALKTRGIGTLIQWRGRSIHGQRKLGFTQQLPRTDRFFERALMLPLNMTVTDGEVETVCDEIEAFYREH
jgi:dTDP-4-amino-4,6-dideoxygalactose transaminase